jgi:dolichol-phosphate mannosyltransferase
MNMPKRLISIVSPAHNEEENIPLIVQAVKAVVGKLEDKYDFEYILVNDGSTDATWLAIYNEALKDKRIKGLNFTKNFGHQIALTAGLDAAKGDAVIYCDSDLQHPPALFVELIQKWEEGNQVVHTKRLETEDAGVVKRLMSYVFYRFINALSDTKIENGMADFKLIDKKVLEVLKTMREQNRFLRGMVPWLGFKSTVVEYKACKRLHGKPWYNFWRNITFAKTGILSFSIKPLKYIGYFGILLTAGSALCTAFSAGYYLIVGSWFLSPVVTLTMFNTLLIGIVLISLGIMSLYLSYVYTEVIDRPLYVLSGTCNMTD